MVTIIEVMGIAWHGVYFVKQGIFAGGIFKFIVEFPPLYPSQRPSVRFLQPVFHPLVNPNTHEVNLDVITDLNIYIYSSNSKIGSLASTGL
jgi:ubiquitin-protein ligase